MEKQTGRVYLVGAGCGAADLITLRGLRLLRGCEAVVYDDLIAPELLDQVPQGAQRRYMGKRCGRHAAPQEEISQVLVELAGAGKTVVRLKGGDPFVFGRGGEEIQALRAAGIPYEEVPGISSAIAIPAAAGIPVTHRGVSRGVHILTGHTAQSPQGAARAMEHLAALEGTLVFLMGLGHLERIAGELMAAGKPPQTPAAVISGGNAPRPAAVRGTLATIAARTREAEVAAPAVIVVGGAAALDFAPTLRRPLEGVRVGLTGTQAVAEKLRSALEDRGAETVRMERPVVEELPLPELPPSGRRRFLVFTSANGVDVFFRQLRRRRIDVRRLGACRFAVIGEGTGARLARYGVYADLCPRTFTTKALAQALCETVGEDEEVLLLRSREGDKDLPRRLRERGIALWDIPLYTLRADGETARRGRAALETLDYLAFLSAGGVERFFQAQGGVSERTVCVCIGAVTARALGARLDRPFLTAEDISAEGIVQAILEHQADIPRGETD